MPSRMPEGKLRQLARERIDNGRLVWEFRTHAWGGRRGSNLPCSLCDEVVDDRDLEYQVESPDENRNVRVYRFHYSCYGIWLEECALDRALDSPA
ncbi:MAG: hypothetical protein ACRD41_17885 [Candidatus Acidiferrales bacterium]